MYNHKKLAEEYRKTLRNVEKTYKNLDRNHPDKRIYSEMMSSIKYIIFWLENGHEKKFGSIDDISKLSYEQRTTYWGDLAEAESFYRQNKQLADNYIENAESQQNNSKINEYLGLLTEREREIFILKYAHSLSFQEVANLLGISKSTVQSLLDRSKKKIVKLRQKLSE